MIFLTKGEFIQAMKDYQTFKNLMEETKEEYHRLNYLRFEKVSSPLDYDVVKYENNEPIREIKGHSYISDEQIADIHEKLDKEIKAAEDKYAEYKVRLLNVESDLKKIEEPLRTMLISRYIKHKTLKQLSREFESLYLDEAGIYKYMMRGLNRYYEY